MPLQFLFLTLLWVINTPKLYWKTFLCCYILYRPEMPNFFDHFAVNSSKRTCNNELGLLSLNASGLNIFFILEK